MQVRPLVGTGMLRRAVRFSALRSLRSLEVKPDEFRRELAEKHQLWIPDFGRVRDVPVERLDEIAAKLIREAERLALVEGASFGLGGMFTLLPDASFLTVITLRLIQRLCLLYGFANGGFDQRLELWKATAAAAGVDYGKDFAERQIVEHLAPKIARRLALKLGAEAAEKWVARVVPLASAAISGTLNFGFVRAWGRRVQKNLRTRHLAGRTMPADFVAVQA